MLEQTNGVYRVTTHSPLANGIMFLLFVVGVIFLLTAFADTSIIWLTLPIGAACIGMGVLMLTVFRFSKLVAEISDEGIYERASKVSKGLIRWEEIEFVYVYESFGTNSLLITDQVFGKKDWFVGITLVDTEAYTEKLNAIQKGIIKAALNMECAPVNIPCNLLGGDADKFAEICNGFIQKKSSCSDSNSPQNRKNLERQVKFMERFCANCGAQITEGKKFCARCGAAIEELQPVAQTQKIQQSWQPHQAPPSQQQTAPTGQQQYAQQPQYQAQVQQPQYQQPYTEAPAKKKRKVPLPIKILLGIIAVIGVIITVALLVTGNTAKQDFIKIGKDEVPSVKYVLGEERNVIGVSSSIENGVSKKVIEYSVDKDQSSEMLKYAQALYSDYGYINLNNNDFTGPTGTDFQFAKESAEDGYIVIVRIDYDLSGYTITLVYGEGALTYNGDNGAVDPNNPTDTDTHGTALTFSTDTPVTDQPVSTEMSGNSDGTERVAGDILRLFDSGTFHMRMIEPDSGLDTDIYIKGGMSAMSFKTEDVNYLLVNKDKKSYMIMYELETIYVFDTNEDTNIPGDSEIDSLTYVSGGTGEFMGRTYRYDEYSAPSGVRTQYFVDGGTLKGIRTIDTDGNISEVEIFDFDNDVPANIFDIPNFPMYDIAGNPIE